MDEHPEESSATAPIWESHGICIAKFGIFEHLCSSLSLIVLLAQHDMRSLMVS